MHIECEKILNQIKYIKKKLLEKNICDESTLERAREVLRKFNRN